MYKIMGYIISRNKMKCEIDNLAKFKFLDYSC